MLTSLVICTSIVYTKNLLDIHNTMIPDKITNYPLQSLSQADVEFFSNY